MTAAEAPIEIETGTAPSASVIWLHGLGADGNDFVPLVPELDLPSAPAVRFVFPHAPFRPVTVNGGFVMRAWYDLSARGEGVHQNLEHLAESVGTVHALAERERRRGIPAERIVLAGFSQGGAVALYAAFQQTEPSAGAIVLSAPVPAVFELLERSRGRHPRMPIFLAHGRRDPVVPFLWAVQVRDALVKEGRAVEWHDYEMEHAVDRDEIFDIRQFLVTTLGC